MAATGSLVLGAWNAKSGHVKVTLGAGKGSIMTHFDGKGLRD